MLDNNNSQKVSIIQEIPIKDKYPTITVNILDLQIKPIDGNSPISFLRENFYEVCINSNLTFVIEKNLKGMLDNGIYTIWFAREDRLDRYIRIIFTQNHINSPTTSCP